jgi:uncharacterized protein YceK
MMRNALLLLAICLLSGCRTCPYQQPYYMSLEPAQEAPVAATQEIPIAASTDQ